MKTRNIIKKLLSISLLLVCITLTSCKENFSVTDISSQGEKSSSTVESASLLESEEVDKVIFDEEAFTEKYVNTALWINTFDSPEELYQSDVFGVCIGHIALTEVKLEDAPNDITGYECVYVPADLIREYAKRYFGIENLDLSEIPDYDEQKDSYIRRKRDMVTSDEIREIKKVKSVEVLPNKIIATVEHIESGMVVYENIYTFVPNSDEYLYKSVVYSDRVGDAGVFFTDDVILFDKLIDTEKNGASARYLANYGNKLLLQMPSNDKSKLVMFNMDTLQAEKQIEVNGGFFKIGIQAFSDVIIVNTLSTIRYYDTDLNLINEIVPPTNYGIPFGSPDGKYVAYADKAGINLYNVETKESKLLFENNEPASTKETDARNFRICGFSNDGKRLITKEVGWEWIYIYRVYNLEDDTYVDINGDSLIATLDSKLNKLFVFTTKYGSGVTKLCQYNLEDMTVLESNLPSEFYVGYYSTGIYSNGYFIQRADDQSDSPLTKIEIHRYNIQTDEHFISPNYLKGYYPSIDVITVLDDSRTLVSYNYNRVDGYAILE